MDRKGHSAKELETRCADLESQLLYYKALAEEAGKNRLREIEQLNRQIAERKKAEERLQESKKRTRSWLEFSPVCTKILDRDFCLQYMSSAGIRALKINDITKFYGQKFPFEAYPEPTYSSIVKNLEKIRQTGEIVTLDTAVFDMVGNRLWFQSTFVPVTDKEGQCDYIIVVSINTTDQKRVEESQAKLEKQLRQAQTLETIGLMAGGVAHDLNNILSGIVGYPDLILNDLPVDSIQRQRILAIKDSGKRAAMVVADLLTITRGVACARERHNLNNLIRECLNSPEFNNLRELYPHITWHDQLDAILPFISCSPVHINKSLINLITNAAEAITGSGTVSITTSNTYLDKRAAHKENLKAGDYFVLAVQDTGKGLSENELARIFEPFFSKKQMGRSGTGLGLTVVWNTVKEHGGNILLHSTNAGTCFQLYFPLTAAQNDAQLKQDPQGEVTTAKELILIVDDNSQILDIASQMLSLLGYKVETVHSGEQAVEFVKKQKVDLIVLDMLMEPGMNGYQTYKEIVKHYPGQKAIITSGFSESEDVKAAIALGVHGFLKKPYVIHQLGTMVKEALAH